MPSGERDVSFHMVPSADSLFLLWGISLIAICPLFSLLSAIQDLTHAKLVLSHWKTALDPFVSFGDYSQHSNIVSFLFFPPEGNIISV